MLLIPFLGGAGTFTFIVCKWVF